MNNSKLINDLFIAMSHDFETMSYYGDNEKDLLQELQTATPEILQEYKAIFLD